MKLLFVCSGNVFRSLTAELCLNEYAKKNGLNLNASSAGITAFNHPVHPAVKARLEDYGLDVSKHKQRKLTKKMLDEADKVFAMGLNHQKFIKEKFGMEVPLFFNEPILDHHEVLFENNLFSDEIIIYIVSIVELIHDFIPVFCKKLLS